MLQIDFMGRPNGCDSDIHVLITDGCQIDFNEKNHLSVIQKIGIQNNDLSYKVLLYLNKAVMDEFYAANGHAPTLHCPECRSNYEISKDAVDKAYRKYEASFMQIGED